MITTEGVVIYAGDSGENGRYIKLLSPEMGLIDVTVRGAKKQNSSNGAATQLFSCGTYCFNESRGRYYLNSSEQKKTFYGLRLDMKKFALVSYFSEIIRYCVTEKQTARDVYRLFMNCIYMLSEKSADCGFIKFIFEMRITGDLGMMPGLLGCAECYRFENIPLFFLIREGLFLCGEHMRTRVVYENEYNVAVTRGMLEAMRHVCLSDMEKLFSFRVSDEALERLCYISENYARYQLGRSFPTLDFYYSIE